MGNHTLCKNNHRAKMVTVVLDQIGPRHKRCLTFPTFTFKQGQNTKHDQINHVQCIPYTFIINLNSMSYIQFILVILYTYFYVNKDYFRDYLAEDQRMYLA